MFRWLRRRFALVLPVALCTSCGFLSDVEKLESFQFTEVEAAPVTPGIDAAGFARQIVMIGQTNTPNRCYVLRAELEEKDNNLTLRVTARSNSTNCDPAPGAFRYEVAIRPLDPGTYHLVVIHSFPGTNLPTEEFRSDVTVR